MKQTKTIEDQKKELIIKLTAQKEIVILNGMMDHFITAGISDSLFNKYCKVIDDINEQGDDYVPTEAQIKAVVDLQAEVKEVLKKAK